MSIPTWIDHLHIETSGPVDGDPVLVMHGWGSNAALMRPVALALEGHFRVFNVDLPGHGTTPAPPEPWGIPEHALLIEALIQERIGQPVHAVGHSNGGRLSLYMAGDPTLGPLIRSLSLISPSGIKPRRTVAYHLRRGLAAALKAPINTLPPPLKSYGQDWLRHTLVWRLLGSSDYSALQGVMRETLVKVVNCYVENRLAAITAPTLVFWGTNDDTISRRQMEVLEQEIADCALIVLEGASHYGYLDRPEAVFPPLLHFLNQVTTRTDTFVS
jgi:pimeloyl-ACP methyl ester carboxylesterase